jgi:Spy/CpxP family protein refolding chaperone
VKRTMLLAAVTILALAAVSPALAERGRGYGEMHGRGPESVADATTIPGLELTPEQAEKIGVLREAHLRESEPLRGELAGKGRALRELWLARTPDRERIMTLQREVLELRARLGERRKDYREQVRRILTPEQQARMEAFERERRPHHERGMHDPPPVRPFRERRGPGGAGRTHETANPL